MNRPASLPQQIAAGLLCIGTLLQFASQARADLLTAHFFESGISRLDEVTGQPTQSGQIPAGTAGLAGPAGLDFGPDGNLYVSSQFTGEILRFNGTTGQPLPSPLAGGRDGLFADLGAGASPGLIRFGPDGNLYVGDPAVENVRVVDGTSGSLLGNAIDGNALAAPGLTIGFTFAPDGTLLVGKSSPIFQGSIFQVDESGMATEIVPPGTAGLQSVNAMLIGPEGELYVADLFGNQILKFDDVNGTNPQTFAVLPPEIPNPLPPGAGFPSNFPSDLVLDPDGNLLVSVLGLTNPAMGGDNRGAVLKYSLDGTLLETIAEGISPVSALLSTDVPGDYNDNGLTEQGDLDLVLGYWGAGAEPLPDEWRSQRPADGGIVDQAELDRILANWGASRVSLAGAAAVPEPTTAMIALLAVAVSIVACGRRKPS